MNSNNPSTDDATTRRGKIARLPLPIREQLNRRLQNGEQGQKLVAWLNSLPETQATLAAGFEGPRITEPNLSKWRAGGYRDWEAKQEALEISRQLSADAPEMADAGAAAITDHVCFRLAARIAMILRDLSNPDDSPNRQLESLAQLCRQLVQLRRGDHDLRWLQIERERLLLHQQKYQDQAARHDDKTQSSKTEAMTLEDFDQFEKDHHLT